MLTGHAKAQTTPSWVLSHLENSSMVWEVCQDKCMYCFCCADRASSGIMKAKGGERFADDPNELPGAEMPAADAAGSILPL